MSTSTETDILAGLDFTIELPCEHSEHDTHHEPEPAQWIAEYTHPCGRAKTYLMCDSGRRLALTTALDCPTCGEIAWGGAREFGLTFRPIPANDGGGW